MHTIKIAPDLLFEYLCTSGKFIRLPNQIESKLFSPELECSSKQAWSAGPARPTWCRCDAWLRPSTRLVPSLFVIAAAAAAAAAAALFFVSACASSSLPHPHALAPPGVPLLMLVMPPTRSGTDALPLCSLTLRRRRIWVPAEYSTVKMHR